MSGRSWNVVARLACWATPMPNSWLSDGPAAPRWVLSDATASVTLGVLGVKVSAPLRVQAERPVLADAADRRVQRVEQVLHRRRSRPAAR